MLDFVSIKFYDFSQITKITFNLILAKLSENKEQLVQQMNMIYTSWLLFVHH